jgi:hypothetical protein
MSTRRHLIPASLVLLLIIVAAWGCNDTPPTEPLLVEMPAGPLLTGQVKDTEGRPAAGAVLSIEPLVSGLAASVSNARLDGGLALEKAAVASTVSDGEGRFQFPGLQPGDYVLTSSLDNHLGGSQPVNLAANADTTFVDIQLTPTGTFIGAATLENASVHDGIVVYVEGTSYLAVTDGSGAYRMTAVPVGTWQLRAFSAGYLDDATSGTLAAAGEEVILNDLFLPLNANMPPVVDQASAGTVDLGDPTPFTVVAHDPDGSIVRYEWDFENDGVFDSSSLTDGNTSHTYPGPGTYMAKLRVTDNGGATGLAVVDVTVLDTTVLPGVFVSPQGSDNNPGTNLAPLQTITAGLDLAALSGESEVYIAAGSYNETVILLDGVNLHGGLDPQNWDEGPAPTVVTGGTRTLFASGITAATLVERIQFVSIDGQQPGESSVTATIRDSGANLVFSACTFTAGNGAAGFDGDNGFVPPSGAPGSPGAPGSCDQAVVASGGNGGGGPYFGGDGGDGGIEEDDGQNGFPGFGGTGFGLGGNSGNTGSPGTNGADGADGSPGAGGVASPPAVIISGNFVVAPVSGDGDPGLPGNGGGGGGGGGGQSGTFVNDGTGNGGGGGGSGGYGGEFGLGGQGGGSSICVVVINSAPTITTCTFIYGSGGDGGSGGLGTPGGQGGPGGAGASICLVDVGRGGDGGDGGDGGAGGGGAGGPGGSSLGIYAPGGGANITGNTYQAAGAPGNGGQGGGGGGPGNAGQDGSAGQSANTVF